MLKVYAATINANVLATAKNELRTIVARFDSDASGENGTENTPDEALALGYKSLIDFLVEESKATSMDAFIRDVIDSVKATWENYGELTYTLEYDSEIQKYLLAVAVICDN